MIPPSTDEARQEALLLRQVAALRRGGLAAHEALSRALPGLGEGPVRQRAEQAARAARAGEAPADPLIAALAGAGPPASLDHLARAREAESAAAAALSGTRLHLALGLCLPLAAASLVAWAFPARLEGAEDFLWEGDRGLWAYGLLLWTGRLGLPVLTVASALLVRLLPALLAPGTMALRASAALLSGAERGDPPLSRGDRRFLELRAASGSASAARVELADELLRRADRQLLLFHHAAPVLGFAFGLAVLLPMIFGLFWAGSMGVVLGVGR